MDMTNFKKALIAALVFAGTSTHALADEANAGKIHFTGQIIAPSCEIKGDSGKDSTVPLGTYPTSLFTDVGTESPLMPFTITLTKCPITSDGLTAVQLTFNGTTTLTNSKTLLDVSSITSATGTDAATNVGVAVTPYDNNTKFIKFDGSENQVRIDLAELTTTDISADFNARYKAFAVPVTAGPADADLTVNILYR